MFSSQAVAPIYKWLFRRGQGAAAVFRVCVRPEAARSFLFPEARKLGAKYCRRTNSSKSQNARCYL